MAGLYTIGECYANKCLAEVLLANLGEGIIVHKRFFGRDRAIKKAHNIARYVNSKILIIIDYEKGKAREYVDKVFNLQRVCRRLFVGVSSKDKRVVAVVIDPDFENGLLCVDPDYGILCEDTDFLRRVKSREACSALEDFLNVFSEGDCFREIVSALNKILTSD